MACNTAGFQSSGRDATSMGSSSRVEWFMKMSICGRDIQARSDQSVAQWKWLQVRRKKGLVYQLLTHAPLDPWRSRKYLLLKHWGTPTQQCSIISQKTIILEHSHENSHVTVTYTKENISASTPPVVFVSSLLRILSIPSIIYFREILIFTCR